MPILFIPIDPSQPLHKQAQTLQLLLPPSPNLLNPPKSTPHPNPPLHLLKAPHNPLQIGPTINPYNSQSKSRLILQPCERRPEGLEKDEVEEIVEICLEGGVEVGPGCELVQEGDPPFFGLDMQYIGKHSKPLFGRQPSLRPPAKPQQPLPSQADHTGTTGLTFLLPRYTFLGGLEVLDQGVLGFELLEGGESEGKEALGVQGEEFGELAEGQAVGHLVG